MKALKIVLATLLIGWPLAVTPKVLAQASVTTLQKDANGQFQLLYNGKPYVIKGVGGTSHLSLLKELGGNSVRTWGIESLDNPVDGKPLKDRAQELGLTITAGIWIEHLRPVWNYQDQNKVNEQREKVRAAVKKYKDTPALLVWGLGNEMEGPTSDGTDPTIWKELEVLAKIVKEEDPNHPVMTVIAGAGPKKIKNLMEYCPSIDIVGVNAYGSAFGVADSLKANGWTKPFVLTEFGPTGQWEVSKTSWGAPNEATSTEKASSYFAVQKHTMDTRNCLGSYAFLWGWKQEATSTWYGMLLPTGEKVGPADAMSYTWTGKWPDKRCPRIKAVNAEFSGKKVAQGATLTASLDVTDPQNSPLEYQWVLMAESTDLRVGGETENVPHTFTDAIISTKNNQVELKVPSIKGAYRLFVYVHNKENSAATANIPFYAE
jgi:hypothetical protein